MADLLEIGATGRWNVALREVSVRPFPYPYVAGFALANENTYANRDLFEEIHGFVSGREATAYGDGLGLEVGDSFAVAPDGSPRLAVGDAGRVDGTRLDQLSQAGWLDSLYCPDTSARRALAGVLARWRPNRRPSVFLGAIGPSDEAALAEAGVRFFGDDGLIEIDKFGDHQDHRTSERFRLAAREYDWGRWIDRARGGEPMSDAKVLAGWMNQTIHAEDRGTGAHLSFKRYCGPWLASMPTFSGQVTSVLLDQLTNLSGAVVVRQQLGRWSLVGAAPARSQARPNESPALDRHAVAAWREIAERNAAGQLWVVTTARLLDHLWRRQALQFIVEKSADKWIVRLQCLSCPVLGERAIESGDLNGLSFTVPESAPEVLIIVGGHRAPLEMRRAPDPAHRLRDAVYRPWAYLEWPER